MTSRFQLDGEQEDFDALEDEVQDTVDFAESDAEDDSIYDDPMLDQIQLLNEFSQDSDRDLYMDMAVGPRSAR